MEGVLVGWGRIGYSRYLKKSDEKGLFKVFLKSGFLRYYLDFANFYFWLRILLVKLD
jgi:hypothetical protein